MREAGIACVARRRTPEAGVLTVRATTDRSLEAAADAVLAASAAAAGSNRTITAPCDFANRVGERCRPSPALPPPPVSAGSTSTRGAALPRRRAPARSGAASARTRPGATR
jgi:hypothetical protein